MVGPGTDSGRQARSCHAGTPGIPVWPIGIGAGRPRGHDPPERRSSKLAFPAPRFAFVPGRRAAALDDAPRLTMTGAAVPLFLRDPHRDERLTRACRAGAGAHV